MTGESGAIDAEKGVLISTDGRSRRLPAPVQRDDITVDGDGWTVKAAPDGGFEKEHGGETTNLSGSSRDARPRGRR